jgi:hypothetical protein
MTRAAALKAILAGGLVAATIDIGSAVLISGHSARRILQTIAGGLLAKASFDGGLRTVFLGLVLQELMGLIIAAIYVGVALRVPTLRRRWIGSGAAYGVLIFFVMNYLVVPLSAWHVVPHFSAVSFLANLLAMLLFGLIVAYCTARFTGAQRGEPSLLRAA